MSPVDPLPGRPSARFLLPFPPAAIGSMPPLSTALWDGRGGPPPQRVLDDVEFFVIPYGFASESAPLLGTMRQLRVVQSLSAGVEDLLPILPPGVVLCNARGVHDTSTAELAVTLILSALRGIPGFVKAQRAESWQSSGCLPSLADRTVLVLGYGSIGEAVEDRVSGFECEVLRVARSARVVRRGLVHALAELPELLPHADVVVLTLPLTEETRGLVDAGFLAAMKDGALLVNVARGAIIDTTALLAELGRGRLSAALDVTDPEPLPVGHPLWHAPRTLISPHVGGNTSAFLPRAYRLVRAQVQRYLAGQELENVVVSPK